MRTTLNEIVFVFSFAILLLICGLVTQVMAADELSPEAMQLGGLVTVDYNPNIENFQEPGLGIGTVELSANVHVADSLLATVVILAEEDMSAMSIDQAVATWNTGMRGLTVYAGQHYFHHGLLTTRLISDPLMLDAVEMAGPGMTATLELGKLAAGLGATVRNYEWTDDSGSAASSNDYTGIVSLDWNAGEIGVARLSSAFAARFADLDAAINLQFKGLSVDAEGFAQLKVPEGAEKENGAYGGLAYALTDAVGIAVRADYLKSGQRAAAGANLSLPHDLFVAVEFGRNMPDGGEAYNELFLQFGLESTLKLPGFQRKTLTRE